MSKIILLHEGELPTVEETYRCYQYLVKKYGVDVNKINSNNVSSDELQQCDVVLCIRGHSPITYFVLREARRIGKKVFYLLDDDLKDMPKGSFWFPERRKWLLKCLKECEVLFTSNKLIAEEYKDFLALNKTVIINTSVDPKTICSFRDTGDVIKIVMAASDWHSQNFIKYVKNAALRISEEYKDKVEWHFVGLHPDMSEFTDLSRVVYVPSMNMENYVRHMKENKYDIGIAVLNPDHFNERKYFNKFIEYTRYGICGIYSDCMPFQLVVKDKENGLLTQNSDEGWYEAFKLLIANPKLKKRCILAAQDYLATQHSEEFLMTKLIEDCKELVYFTAPKDEGINKQMRFLWKARQVIFRCMESIYLTFSSLSHFGIKETLFRIKRKVKHEY